MAKKRWNQLDPGTITLARLVAHADPNTGKQLKATWADVVALFAAQTPVKSYADEAALLANTSLVIGYLAYQVDEALLYLYNGPDPDDIGNYTLLLTDSSGLVSQTLPASVVIDADTNDFSITGAGQITLDGDDIQITSNNDILIGSSNDATLDASNVLNLGAGDHIQVNSTQIKNIADGTDPQDAVSKAQLDAAALGIVTSWKAPVKVSTTVAGTLASDFENGDTIDGVVLATGDRILIKNQAAATENGIYVVAASGAPARSSDANVAAELEGAAVTVQQGTSNANTTWIQTTDAINLGVSNIVFAQLGTSVPDADATTKGIVERAIQSETNTGSDDTRFVTPLQVKSRDGDSVALTDGASIDITSDKHTLTTALGRTFTISFVGENITIELTLTAASATQTFPSGSLCVSEGLASEDNTCPLAGTSGDKYIISIKKIGSAYYVVAKNFRQ